MIVRQVPDGILIEGAEHFHPRHTFACGQCFRWHPRADGSYTGVVSRRAANISACGNDIMIRHASLEDYHTIWHKYLDFDRDYGALKAALRRDETLRPAISYGWGIRILAQDAWESLISFIISANNHIPRITGIIERMSQLWGEPFSTGGHTYYSFPSPDALAALSIQDLAPIRAGYRADYILDAARKVAGGQVRLADIALMSAHNARRELLGIKGVGPKVADCILLFGMGKFDVFPSDVWIKRVMREVYGCEEQAAASVGQELFGEYCGIAQQYLFFWRRDDGGNPTAVAGGSAESR